MRDAVQIGGQYTTDELEQTQVQTQIDTINEQWNSSGKNIGDLGNFVCMVDTSGSMECDAAMPLYAAIGLGMRASEKSILGNRVMTFSTYPKWLNLEEYDNFVDKVNFLKKDNSWGNRTNFHAALKLVADACVDNDVPPHQVKDLVLAIFSDMQIDQADASARTMDKQIQDMFYDAGMRSRFKVPYDAPHLLFWNLRSTSGFPSLSTEKNISMMSGFSPSLLNSFQNKGMEALQDCTPWRMLIEQLQHERYMWGKEALIHAIKTEPGDIMSVTELPNIYEPAEIIITQAEQEQQAEQ